MLIVILNVIYLHDPIQFNNWDVAQLSVSSHMAPSLAARLVRGRRYISASTCIALQEKSNMEYLGNYHQSMNTYTNIHSQQSQKQTKLQLVSLFNPSSFIRGLGLPSPLESLANVQLPAVGVNCPSSGSSEDPLWKSPNSPKESNELSAISSDKELKKASFVEIAAESEKGPNASSYCRESVSKTTPRGEETYVVGAKWIL